MRQINHSCRIFWLVSGVVLSCFYANAQVEKPLRPGDPILLTKPGETQRQQKPPVTSQPAMQSDKKTGADLFVMKGIAGEVRWKKEYGLPYNTSNDGRSTHPYPCQVFKVRSTIVVTATPPITLPAGTSADVGTIKGKDFGTAGPPRGDGDYYICRFTVADLPFNRAINIQVDIDPSFLPPGYTGFDRSIRLSAAWIGGSEPQPPAGNYRKFIGNKSVTLTEAQTNAKLVFEMVYAP